MVFTVVEIFWSSETGRDSDKPLFILTGPRRGGAGFVGEFFNHHSGSDLQAKNSCQIVKNHKKPDNDRYMTNRLTTT